MSLPSDPRLVIGDLDESRSYHAQWPFAAKVAGAGELMWVAKMILGRENKQYTRSEL